MPGAQAAALMNQQGMLMAMNGMTAPSANTSPAAGATATAAKKAKDEEEEEEDDDDSRMDEGEDEGKGLKEEDCDEILADSIMRWRGLPGAILELPSPRSVAASRRQFR